MRRLHAALQRLDIPSRRDIEELSHRISRLERVLATLSRDRQNRKQ